MSQQESRKPQGRREGQNRRNQDEPEADNRQFRGNRQNRNQQDDDGRPFRKKFIKKNHDKHGGRGKKFDHRGDRDLDRELRDYWITRKGGQGAQVDGKELAREKLNAQMEQYWKKRKQQAEKGAQ